MVMKSLSEPQPIPPGPPGRNGSAASPPKPIPLARPARGKASTPMVVAGAVVLLVFVLFVTTTLLRRGKVTRLVAASREIPVGTQVTPQMLKSIQYRGDAVPPGLVGDRQAVVGKTTVAVIHAGAPFTSYAVTAPAADSTNQGMALALPRPNLVNGDLTAGDTVDVLVVQKTSAGAGEGMWVGENVKVSDARHATGRDASGATILLEATPQQSQLIYAGLALVGPAQTYAVRSTGLGPGHVAVGVWTTSVRPPSAAN